MRSKDSDTDTLAPFLKKVRNLSPDQIQAGADRLELAIDECQFGQNEKVANSPQS
jgi:hypothetical protein